MTALDFRGYITPLSKRGASARRFYADDTVRKCVSILNPVSEIDLTPLTTTLTTLDGLETGTDGRHSTRRTASFAVDEIQTADLVTLQQSIRGAAHLTRHVFVDILSEQTLNLFWDKAAFEHQAAAAVNRSFVTQLSLSTKDAVAGQTGVPRGEPH